MMLASGLIFKLELSCAKARSDLSNQFRAPGWKMLGFASRNFATGRTIFQIRVQYTFVLVCLLVAQFSTENPLRL
jgi:hypothetical protein